VANFYGRPRAYVAFQVRLTPELKEKLMRRSFETGQSQVAIVNLALETYFANVAAEEANAPPPASTGGDGQQQ
jgi:predicted DNA-binding protein